jgi:hypothetical protein
MPAVLAASGRLQRHLLVFIVQGAIAMVRAAVALATVGLLTGLVAGFIGGVLGVLWYRDATRK